MLLILQIWVKGHKSAYNYKYTNVKYIPACTLVLLAFLAAIWLHTNLCRYLNFVLVYEIKTAIIFISINIKNVFATYTRGKNNKIKETDKQHSIVTDFSLRFNASTTELLLIMHHLRTSLQYTKY